MNRIHEFRQQLGWSRQKLATVADVSISYLRDLEKKKVHRPTIDVCYRIANALGRSVEEVFPPEVARSA